VTDNSRWVPGEVREVFLVWGVPSSSGPLCLICGDHRLLFPRHWSGLNANLTSHLHPVPMARMSGAMPPLSRLHTLFRRIQPSGRWYLGLFPMKCIIYFWYPGWSSGAMPPPR